MKNIVQTISILLLISTTAFCQTGHENISEGFLLRKLELASGYAQENLKSNHRSIFKNGFKEFSYQDINKDIITVFINDLNQPKILARFIFDSIPNFKPLKVEISDLILSSGEISLFNILADANKKIIDQYNGNFPTISAYSYRAIPLRTNKDVKVIVYAKPAKKSKTIVFGNDYELKYDSAGNYVSIKKFHENPTTIPFNPGNAMATFHEHQTSDEISSTDVCRLLLNKNNIKWKQHIVLNPEYVSVFMVQKEGYILMLREEFDETMKKLEEHKKNSN